MSDTLTTPGLNKPHDASFEKYDTCGAYHWREIGWNLRHHNAFTMERYRRTLKAAELQPGQRALDYGCGDGALLAIIKQRVGDSGTAIGFDPNREAVSLATQCLQQRGIDAQVRETLDPTLHETFDRIICAEVIEHVHEPRSLLRELHRLLKPGGLAVVTTPIRLTKDPIDPNHVQEWFFEDFAEMITDSPLRVIDHQAVMPVAAAEIYHWRPYFFAKLAVTRTVCNLFSILGCNALSLLRCRRCFYMTQIAVLQKCD